jgi:hypothetical protein
MPFRRLCPRPSLARTGAEEITKALKFGTTRYGYAAR